MQFKYKIIDQVEKIQHAISKCKKIEEVLKLRNKLIHTHKDLNTLISVVC